MTKNRPVLVAGATGYIGGRLVPLLLERGYRVRAMARSRQKLSGRLWSNHPRAELVAADLLDPAVLASALAGCGAAYYLVHSMNPAHRDYVDIDRTAALNFVAAAEKAGVERVIYLGGMGWDQANASAHLKSRYEVGEILQSSHIPVTRLRAAQIIGSGSACFEMARYLLERMPFFVIPASLVETRIQPISIRNVLAYLAGCLELEETLGQSYEIGGPDILTYRRLFQICAEEKGLKAPVFLDIPEFALGKRIGFGVVQWTLPIPKSVSKPLLEGMAVQVVLKDHRIRDVIPQKLISCREAVSRAVKADALHQVETRWTDAGALNPPEWILAGDAPYAGGTLLQSGFQMRVADGPDVIWPTVSRIGGSQGWYFADSIWRIIGWCARLFGGSGLWRRRRDPEELRIGDVIDFWRVLDIQTNRRLVLLSEKTQPGDAILALELLPRADGTEVRINVWFSPRQPFGFLHWFLLLPFRHQLFRGMLTSIADQAGCRILQPPEKMVRRPAPPDLY